MEKKNGFTLSETLIVVVVLGIIATLTIPALVNKNKESVAKTKVKKAMASYESALNKMIIENDLKDNKPLTDWAGNAENNCANSTNYFKKVQGDGCIFKTSDGIWWNISDIERPLIAFKDTDLTPDKANSTTDMSAFVLVGRFGTDGSLRVDDLAYETANSVDDAYGNSSKTQVEKLYKLLGLKRSSAGGGAAQSPFAACKAQNAETCIVNGVEYILMALSDESNEYCMYNEEKNEDICNLLSTSSAGNYYIAVVGFPDDYNLQAHNYDGSTCQECIDNNSGDYYNAAKRYCSPGRLATMAELKSLYSQGLLPKYAWWAFEEDVSRSPYFVNYYGGNNSYGSKSNENVQVLCIGQ